MVIPFPAVGGAIVGQFAGELGERLLPPSPPVVIRSETTAINPWWFVLGAFLVYVVARGGRR